MMIKRIMVAAICTILLVVGYTYFFDNNVDNTKTKQINKVINSNAEDEFKGLSDTSVSQTDILSLTTGKRINQIKVSDFENTGKRTKLLKNIEYMAYQDIISSLGSNNYIVENVSATYLSKEYLDELAFNSQANIFFGHSLNELNKIFKGNKYIFTLGEDGKTQVREVQEITITDSDKILKNVAIGSGVIFVCVVVTILSEPIAPVVSLVFATSASTAIQTGGAGVLIGGVTKFAVTAYETGDYDYAAQKGALAASDLYKWGAIFGSVNGIYEGLTKVKQLVPGTEGGLTLNQVARIQQESHYSIDTIKQIRSWDEYEIYKQASSVAIHVNGRDVLVPKAGFDLNYKGQLRGESEPISNLERIKKGNAPLDPNTNKYYQLHHMGQKNDSTLVVLTEEQHLGSGNKNILHDVWKPSEINREAFDNYRNNFWKYYADSIVTDEQ